MKSIRGAINKANGNSRKRKMYRARGGQQSGALEHEYGVQVLGEFVVLDDDPTNRDAPTYGKFTPGALEDEISFYTEYFKKRNGEEPAAATKRLLELKVYFSKMFGPNSKFSEENPLFICMDADEQKKNFIEALQTRLERLRGELELETPAKLVLSDGVIDSAAVAAAVEEASAASAPGGAASAPGGAAFAPVGDASPVDPNRSKIRERHAAWQAAKAARAAAAAAAQSGGSVDLNGLKARAKYDQTRRLARLIDKLEDATGCIHESSYGDKVLALSTIDDQKIQNLLRQFSFLVLQGHTENKDPKWLQYQGNINPKEFIKKLEQHQIPRDQMNEYLRQYKELPYLIIKILSGTETQDEETFIAKLQDDVLEKLFEEISQEANKVLVEESDRASYADKNILTKQRIISCVKALVGKFEGLKNEIRDKTGLIETLESDIIILTRNIAELGNQHADAAAALAAAAAGAAAAAAPSSLPGSPTGADSSDIIAELQEKLVALQRELAEKNAALEAAKSEQGASIAEAEAANASLNKINIELTSQLAAAEQDAQTANKKAEESEALAKQHEAAAAEALAQAQSQGTNQDEITRLQAQLAAAKEAAEAAVAAAAAAKAAAEELDRTRAGEKEALQAENQRLTSTVEQQSAAIAAAEAAAAANKAAEGTSAATAAAKAAAEEELRQAKADLEAAQGQSSQRVKELQEQLADAQAASTSASAAAAAANAGKAAAEAALQQAAAAAESAASSSRSGASSSSSAVSSESTSNDEINALINMIDAGNDISAEDPFFTNNKALAALFKKMDLKNTFKGDICTLAYFVTDLLNKLFTPIKVSSVALTSTNILQLQPFGTGLNAIKLPQTITDQIKRQDMFAVMSHIMIKHKERAENPIPGRSYAEKAVELTKEMNKILGEDERRVIVVPPFTSDIKTYTYHLTNIFNTFKHIDRINSNKPQANSVYYLPDNTTIKFLLYKLHTDPLTTGDGNRILNTSLTTEFNKQPYFKSLDNNNLQGKVDLFDIAIVDKKPAVIFSFDNRTNPRVCTQYNIENTGVPISQNTIQITFPFKDNLKPTFTTSLKYTSLLGYFLILAGSYLNKKEFTCKSSFITNTFSER
jgi:hypothetical protein